MAYNDAEGDFDDIRVASSCVEERLLEDDKFARDLGDQMDERAVNGAYKIFLEPYKTGLSGAGSIPRPMPMLRENQSAQHSISIPQRLLELRSQAKLQTLMGILPEINRVWVSVDDCLYMWHYTSPHSEFELAYKVRSHDNIFIYLISRNESL